MSRLFANYPVDKIVVLTGSHLSKLSPADGRLGCKHIVFPTTKRTGKWGVGRIKSFLDWLLIPILALLGIWVIKQRRIKIIVTIAHGHFFLAATLASLAISVPLILIVHDDWVFGIRSNSYFLKYFCSSIFRFVTKKASYIYTISKPMQEVLKSEYGVESELQMPAAEYHSLDDSSSPPSEQRDPQCIRIVYAGTGSGTVADSLDMLIRLIKGDKLRSYGLKSWQLHIYTLASSEQVKQFVKQLGWQNERIIVHNWVSQAGLGTAFATADILFLPYSFCDNQKLVTTRSFSTKTADYLASGKPILIFAPSYSSVAQYAKKFEFAEVVDKPDEESLAQGIYKIWSSKDYCEKLQKNALSVFEQNHNIVKQRDNFVTLVSRLS